MWHVCTSYANIFLCLKQFCTKTFLLLVVSFTIAIQSFVKLKESKYCGGASEHCHTSASAWYLSSQAEKSLYCGDASEHCLTSVTTWYISALELKKIKYCGDVSEHCLTSVTAWYISALKLKKIKYCGDVSEHCLTSTSVWYLSSQWAQAWVPRLPFLSAWLPFCFSVPVRFTPQWAAPWRGEETPPTRKLREIHMRCPRLTSCWSTSGLSWEKKSFMANPLALTILSALSVSLGMGALYLCLCLLGELGGGAGGGGGTVSCGATLSWIGEFNLLNLVFEFWRGKKLSLVFFYAVFDFWIERFVAPQGLYYIYNFIKKIHCIIINYLLFIILIWCILSHSRWCNTLSE